MTFKLPVDAVCKKAHQHMYFKCKLWSFNVDKSLWKCIIPVLLNQSCHPPLSARTGHRPSETETFCRVSSKLSAKSQAKPWMTFLKYTRLGLRWRPSQSWLILAPPSNEFKLLPSGRWYNQTNRLKNSSFPAAVGLLNNSVWFLYCTYCLSLSQSHVLHCWLYNKLPLWDNKDILDPWWTWCGNKIVCVTKNKM